MPSQIIPLVQVFAGIPDFRQNQGQRYALSAILAFTLAQQGLPDKSNELGHIQELLAELALPGNVVTTDALHARRQADQTIVGNGSDRLMIVKENQPQLRVDIATLFQEPQAVTDASTQTRTIESGMAASKSAA